MKICSFKCSQLHLHCSFDKRSKKVCQKAKSLLDDRKIWDKKERFYITFPSISSCGLVKWSFDDPAKNVFDKNRKIFAQVRKWLENFKFYFFSSKSFDKHLKSSSFNSVEKLLSESEKVFAQYPKMTWKGYSYQKQFLLKLFLATRSTQISNKRPERFHSRSKRNKKNQMNNFSSDCSYWHLDCNFDQTAESFLAEVHKVCSMPRIYGFK